MKTKKTNKKLNRRLNKILRESGRYFQKSNFCKKIGIKRQNFYERLVSERLALEYCVEVKKIFGVNLIDLVIELEEEAKNE